MLLGLVAKTPTSLIFAKSVGCMLGEPNWTPRKFSPFPMLISWPSQLFCPLFVSVLFTFIFVYHLSIMPPENTQEQEQGQSEGWTASLCHEHTYEEKLSPGDLLHIAVSNRDIEKSARILTNPAGYKAINTPTRGITHLYTSPFKTTK